METRWKVSGGSEPLKKAKGAAWTPKNLKFFCMQGTGEPTRN